MGPDPKFFLEIELVTVELAEGVLIFEYDNFCIEGCADDVGEDTIIIMRFSVVDGVRFDAEEGSCVLIESETFIPRLISRISIGDIIPLGCLHIVSQIIRFLFQFISENSNISSNLYLITVIQSIPLCHVLPLYNSIICMQRNISPLLVDPASSYKRYIDSRQISSFLNKKLVVEAQVINK